MMLELPRDTKIGTPLTIKLTLPSGPPLLLEAVVKHSQPIRRAPTPAPERAAASPARFQVGVEFRNLDAEKRTAIEKRIKANTVAGAPRGLVHRADLEQKR